MTPITPIGIVCGVLALVVTLAAMMLGIAELVGAFISALRRRRATQEALQKSLKEDIRCLWE